MPRQGSRNTIPIALIAPRGDLAGRVRKAVKGSGFALEVEVLPEDVNGGSALDGAEVLVVAGPLDSADGSLVSRLSSRFPAARIVACCEPVEWPSIRWAMELGVDGLVWSDRLDECLEPTLRAVQADQVVVPRDVLRRQPRELTNREKQALSMVIMGLTNLEIAQKLFISENTVKSHLNTAYKKLGVHSRAEAQRLITDPDKGLGTGILAITAPGLSRGRPPKTGRN